MHLFVFLQHGEGYKVTGSLRNQVRIYNVCKQGLRIPQNAARLYAFLLQKKGLQL